MEAHGVYAAFYEEGQATEGATGPKTHNKFLGSDELAQVRLAMFREWGSDCMHRDSLR